MTADARYYGRVWRVTAFRPSGSFELGPTTIPALFDGVPNGIEVTALQVQFEVEKTLKSEPNTCEIKITNLREEVRNNIVEKPLMIKLDAGHEQDAGLRLVFSGDLRYGYSKQEGASWVTTLGLGDGSRAYASARVDGKSFGPGTSLLTVARECAAAMGLKLPSSVETDENLARQFAGGASLSGHARDELSRLLAPYGYSWSIQDGRLMILADDQVRPDRALVIRSAAEGGSLLGSPEFATPSKTDNKKGRSPSLHLRTILDPSINPGSMLSVQSRAINGIFRAEKVRHVGNSHGDDWVTEVEARAADGFKAAT